MKLKLDLNQQEQWMLKDFLCRLLKCCPSPKVRLDFGVGPVTRKRQTTTKHMDITITNEEKVLVTLAPKTSTGKPAKLDGKPEWRVESGDSTIEVADDGLSATLISSDTPGDTIFIVEADADIGEGIETIAESLKLTVSGAKAANLGIVVGEPEAKA